ncbi:succinate dehydrogenase, cytochrome b556 subunit [Sphingomonas sp. ac-8]|uniref:succinate dehydrogenase, cytochrome b556 subunit n=1 Tax=Sphingomonas sp. ac-8 TaxID=3242977 RepID=UPI003A7FF341
MASKPYARPLSPHLGIWRWGPHMLVSIVHRACGVALSVGLALMVWWLAALAGGEKSYARFVDVFTLSGGGLNVIGYIVGIGLTLALFQHMASGVRHFVLDIGAGYELRKGKQSAMATLVFSPLATIAFWAWLLAGKF